MTSGRNDEVIGSDEYDSDEITEIGGDMPYEEELVNLEDIFEESDDDDVVDENEEEEDLSVDKAFEQILEEDMIDIDDMFMTDTGDSDI
jgi:hypothetical protein